MDLSIVVTIYNDAELIPVIVDKIQETLLTLDINYEIILVNDCSSDNSEAVIALVCEQNEAIRGISLSRNFGQQLAMSAGIHHATGNYIVIMDGDMQNPPSAIPLLLEKIKEEYDIVYTISSVRNSWREEMSSRLFWFFITKVLKEKVVPNQLMMRIMSKNFATIFSSYYEVNRSIFGITADIGFKHAVIEVENSKRKIGKSNYNFMNRMNLMIEIIVSSSNAPLNFIIYLSLITVILSISIFAYQIFAYIFDIVPMGFFSIISSQLFFGSLNTFLFGLLGKYLSNIYNEVRRRPLYIVSSKFNIK